MRGLVPLDELSDSARRTVAVAMAHDGIAAARGIDADVGPDEARVDGHRGDLRHRNALLLRPDEVWFDANDSRGAHLDPHRKPEVAAREATRLEHRALLAHDIGSVT